MKLIFLLSLFLIAQPGKAAGILWIGDSHSAGYFGDEIQALMKKSETALTRVGSCGASASSFFKNYETKCGYVFESPRKTERSKVHETPRLSDLVSSEKPDEIIIALGTNYLGQSDAQLNQDVDRVFQELEKNPSIQKCTWIGPPDIGRPDHKIIIQKIDQQLQNRMREKKCKYVSSLAVTTYPNGKSDGIHYPPAEARSWAQAIFAKLQAPKSELGPSMGIQKKSSSLDGTK